MPDQKRLLILASSLVSIAAELLGGPEMGQVSADTAPPATGTKKPKAVAGTEPTPAAATPVAATTPNAAVPYEDVKKAVLHLANTKGKPDVVAVLQTFGVANAKDLKPEQYTAALAAFTAAANPAPAEDDLA